MGLPFWLVWQGQAELWDALGHEVSPRQAAAPGKCVFSKLGSCSKEDTLAADRCCDSVKSSKVDLSRIAD